ncbi:hypothetical protein HHK36_019517 [Tetracentron sinense]|uniref:Mitochondrial transcription termination factor n=1 Tax=Tetracentron sinense TaxID=13715 RepID=A0A835DCC3_TETSI|nr:hypothetical protein HHK36_019517 [Tetracentron sinense]
MFRSLFRSRWNKDSTIHFYLLQISSPKSISHISKSTIQEPSLTVDYLVNSCGLSPESALKAAQQINIKTTSKPDSVLKLFRNYGFTNTHIAKLITKFPQLLLADPNKNLKPKIEFFRNNGVSDPILAKFLSANPKILRRSLENQIIPSFNIVKSFLHTDENIAFALERTTWILHSIQKSIGPNVAILRSHGVPESMIFKIIITRPRLLSLETDHFSRFVTKIVQMGFDPLSLMFVYGLRTLLGMKKSTWEAKLKVYKSFGWSEDEILSMFRKQPVCMAPAEEKISKRLDFFMNKLNLTPAYISKYPTTLVLSLEKRTMPRCSVFDVLVSKGLMKKGSMGKALIVTEDVFLKNYVVRYQEDLPQLLKLEVLHSSLFISEPSGSLVMVDSEINRRILLKVIPNSREENWFAGFQINFRSAFTQIWKNTQGVNSWMLYRSVLYMLYLKPPEVAGHRMLDVLH